MKRRAILLVLIALVIHWKCKADEGMWIPMLLEKYNIEDMQKQGFKLTAEDVYAINRASLKDAVIGLGREGRPFAHFCTGNLVSDEGLVITNHHCAFDMIQSHSSLEYNYLRDGFWARAKSEELANPGITASILVRMEDVTDKIVPYLKEHMTEAEREAKIKQISKKLEAKAVKGTDLQANIKPYFNGNQFFMSVFRIYKDVRLVGAPPSAIGKFGGDTDNWTWPRHTGDFSVLRIYAGENNEPAKYSEKNKPYRPAKHFKVSTAGVQEGDFTLVFGYPGTTNEYLTSYAVEQVQNIENPHKIAIRTAKLNVINKAMESDELLRIKYAAKAAGVANAWKKWQGEVKGLKRFNTVMQKQKLEQDFSQWADSKNKYEGLLDKYKEVYDRRKDLILASAYLNEAGLGGAEVIRFALTITDSVKKQVSQENLKVLSDQFFKNYDSVTDEKILVEMLKLYNRNLEPEWIPAEIAKAGKAKDYPKFAAGIFGQSVFTSAERMVNFISRLNETSIQELEKDPVYILAVSIRNFNAQKLRIPLDGIRKELTQLNRLWLAGLMEMQPEKKFYADANSTLRVAYGKIGGYSPFDAVYYKPYTTLGGIMEKDNPDIYDYNVPQQLRDIYRTKNFGKYASNGDVPVCFIANNHTTGGNSGSPVLNARGDLIGLNFDRAWDGVMSDMQYDPSICRNISVDIRYVLFIIDKFADANHLIDEMELVN